MGITHKPVVEHPARVVVDALEATMMHIHDERFFESERERRLFYRLVGLLRHYVERELDGPEVAEDDREDGC